MPTANLLTALNEVALAMPAIPKTETGGAFTGTYRTYDELINVAGPLLAKHGIIPIPNDEKLEREVVERRNKHGETWTTLLSTLTTSITLWHTSGEQLTVKSISQSIDQGAFAPGIARTYSLKDVLSRALMVAFDGPEEEARPTDGGHYVAMPLSDQVRAAVVDLDETGINALRAWLQANNMATTFAELDEAGLTYALSIIEMLKTQLVWPKSHERWSDQQARTLWNALNEADQKTIQTTWGGVVDWDAHPPEGAGLVALHDLLLAHHNARSRIYDEEAAKYPDPADDLATEQLAIEADIAEMTT